MKSGIVEMLPKRKKAQLEVGSLFENIPVMENYKYLGLVIDRKLDGDLQMKKMQQKIDSLHSRLAPILGKVSTDYRINLWKLLVKPLFKPGVGIMYSNTKTRKEKMQRPLLPKNY